MEQPAVLIVKTRRFHEHVGIMRMPEYVTYPEDDPLRIGFQDAAAHLGDQKDEVLGDVEREVEWRIEEAFDKAEAAPWPEASDNGG
jgi:TPP-dependent pyruvate/acetoin dehydrogenase alpha subunit